MSPPSKPTTLCLVPAAVLFGASAACTVSSPPPLLWSRWVPRNRELCQSKSVLPFCTHSGKSGIEVAVRDESKTEDDSTTADIASFSTHPRLNPLGARAGSDLAPVSYLLLAFIPCCAVSCTLLALESTNLSSYPSPFSHWRAAQLPASANPFDPSINARA